MTPEEVTQLTTQMQSDLQQIDANMRELNEIHRKHQEAMRAQYEKHIQDLTVRLDEVIAAGFYWKGRAWSTWDYVLGTALVLAAVMVGKLWM